MQDIRNIVLIGAGNVATQLGRGLHEAGLNIVQVWSRTMDSAAPLAGMLGAEAVTEPGSLKPADLYILAVADDAITDVAKRIGGKDRFLVHTSGSVPMGALGPYAGDHGVIYPVQTFSRARQVDLRTVPFCIEAGSLDSLDRLSRLMSDISQDIHVVPSEQRKLLHLAAVFACNFPNFMYSIADVLVNRAKLDFDVLRPLIRETAEKVQEMSPDKAQTGPAIRSDRQVMDGHLELLRDLPEYRDLYKRISQAIEDFHDISKQ